MDNLMSVIRDWTQNPAGHRTQQRRGMLRHISALLRDAQRRLRALEAEVVEQLYRTLNPPLPEGVIEMWDGDVERGVARDYRVVRVVSANRTRRIEMLLRWARDPVRHHRSVARALRAVPAAHNAPHRLGHGSRVVRQRLADRRRRRVRR